MKVLKSKQVDPPSYIMLLTHVPSGTTNAITDVVSVVGGKVTVAAADSISMFVCLHVIDHA